jgi:hypothetical protein
LLFTAKRQKKDPKNDAKEQANRMSIGKKSKASPNLTLEEQAAKNAAFCVTTIEQRQAAPAKQELGKS